MVFEISSFAICLRLTAVLGLAFKVGRALRNVHRRAFTNNRVLAVIREVV